MKAILSTPRAGSLAKKLTTLLGATSAWLSLFLFPTSARAAFGSLYVAASGQLVARILIALGLLMLIIEPISHLARLISLTARLYGNMFAGDLVILVFLSLIPIGVPIIFIGLHIGVAFIQAYVFVLLATVYLAGAVAEEH